MYKILLIGSRGCCKHSLLKRWFGEDTIEHKIVVYSKFIRPHPSNYSVYNDTDMKLNLFRLYSSAYIIMFDVSDITSFEEVKKVYTHIYDEGSSIPIALLGHKADLYREISVATAREYADANRISYFESSIDDLDSIDRLFINIADQINDIRCRPVCTHINVIQNIKIQIFRASVNNETLLICYTYIIPINKNLNRT
jgi:hypothetical protein